MNKLSIAKLGLARAQARLVSSLYKAQTQLEVELGTEKTQYTAIKLGF